MRKQPIIDYILFETIYGIAAIAAICYGIFWTIKKLFPKSPNPFLIAGPVFVIGLLTIPSIPRYQFEQEILAQIERSPWVRVVDQAKWGDITEPLTLIKTPVKFVKMVMPNSRTIGGFKEVVLRYDEEPIISVIDAYCDDYTYELAQPDADGTFRIMKDLKKMTDEERELFCEYGWVKEREALREEILRQMSEQKRVNMLCPLAV